MAIERRAQARTAEPERTNRVRENAAHAATTARRLARVVASASAVAALAGCGTVAMDSSAMYEDVPRCAVPAKVRIERLDLTLQGKRDRNSFPPESMIVSKANEYGETVFPEIFADDADSVRVTVDCHSSSDSAEPIDFLVPYWLTLGLYGGIFPYQSSMDSDFAVAMRFEQPGTGATLHESRSRFSIASHRSVTILSPLGKALPGPESPNFPSYEISDSSWAAAVADAPPGIDDVMAASIATLVAAEVAHHHRQ